MKLDKTLDPQVFILRQLAKIAKDVRCGKIVVTGLKVKLKPNGNQIVSFTALGMGKGEK